METPDLLEIVDFGKPFPSAYKAGLDFEAVM